MNMRSPLGRVLGLGAAKDGVGHWWLQRLTSVALVPLTLWFFFSVVGLGSLEYEAVKGWLMAPVNALGVVLLVLVLAYHSKLGVQVVVEDYVHHHGCKVAILIAIDFAHVVAAAAAVFAVLRVSLVGAA